MKDPIRHLLCPFAAVLGLPAIWAANPAPPPPPEGQKQEMRVITRTDRPGPPARRPLLREGERETVAFLGVQASPASKTLAAQLGLPAGAGLVVNHVLRESPAAGVLQEHDILLKLDDQLLIETRQLSVLIRQRKEGDEVTLTYLRGGKEATARIKLGKHEVPKMSAALEHALPGAPMNGFSFGPGQFRVLAPERSREEVDRVLSLIERGPHGGPGRMEMDRRRGPGLRAISVNAANSNLTYSDDAGSLELTIKDGSKSLLAKDASGKELFSGPVNTPMERQKLPPAVRERLGKIEGMRDVTFRTDEDFRGAETKILQPFGRGISLPLQPRSPPAPRPAPFF